MLKSGHHAAAAVELLDTLAERLARELDGRSDGHAVIFFIMVFRASHEDLAGDGIDRFDLRSVLGSRTMHDVHRMKEEAKRGTARRAWME